MSNDDKNKYCVQVNKNFLDVAHVSKFNYDCSINRVYKAESNQLLLVI